MNPESPDPTPPPRRRIRWFHHDGIDIGDVVVQFFAVLLGVLLALLINQWTDQRRQQAEARAATRQQQQSADEAMRAIRAELLANRTALHQSAAQLTAMAQAMRNSSKNKGQSARWCTQWDGWAGTNTANLVEAAYQTAIATQALSYMPFKQAQLVAQAYGHQHVEQKDFELIQSRVLVAGPQTLDICLEGILGTVRDEHALSGRYDPLIGPDTASWPALQTSAQSVTPK